MSKKILQDIKIKNLTEGVVRRPRIVQKEPASVSDFFEKKRSTRNVIHDVETGKKRSKSRYALWFVAAVSFIFFLFALSYLFLRVQITVNPKIQDVVLNENFSASKNATPTTLPFDLIVISGEESRSIPTTGEQDVAQKATGVVVVYNAFGAEPQRLDIDTRLEGSNGKIYKTQRQIVVPGMKGNVPGSIEVGVYASVAGGEYNSVPLDFTVLGFKGTPKYSKFYARSKGDIAGGFKGKAPVLADADKSTTVDNMKTTLQEKLFKKATDQIPVGFVLLKNGFSLHIDDNNINVAVAKDNMLPVTIKGTFYGLLFDEAKLSQQIAQNNIPSDDISDIYVSNLRDLTFSLSDTGGSSLGDAKSINFHLSGTAKIVWKLNEDKFTADLLGKSRKEFNQILSQYPNIHSADVLISPFWKMSFPDKTKDIKIIVNYPK